MKEIDCWQAKFESYSYSDALLNKLVLINEQIIDKIDLLEIKKAIYYAKKHHGAQKRQSGEPYYTHPIEVACMVADYCCEVNALVAAILHDVVEDTSASVADISNIFGCRVAQIVERLTRFQLPNYRISSGELIMHAHTLNDNVAVLIKLLDRLHNLQTIHVKTQEKQQKNYLEVIETFFILAFKIDHKIVDQFQDYLNRNATTQKLQQEDSIFSYGAYQLQFLDFQNNF